MSDRLFLACSICNTSLDRGVSVDKNGHCTPTFNHNSGKHRSIGWVSEKIACPRCGNYTISNEAYEYLENSLRKNNVNNILSYYICNEFDQETIIQKKDVERLLRNSYLPNPSEQANALLCWIADKSSDMGDRVHVDPYSAGARIGAFGDRSIATLFRELSKAGLLIGDLVPFYKNKDNTIPQGAFVSELTLLGWERVEAIKAGNNNSKTAFIAMEYGQSELDNLVSEHMKPELLNMGYNLRRLDEYPAAGLIDDNLRLSIKSAKFVIVDLTHDNSGAYWEAGYAEGLGKVVIYICNEQKFNTSKSHFDTNHHLHVLWSTTKIDDFVKRLKATIEISV
jgi:hypothetical protein